MNLSLKQMVAGRKIAVPHPGLLLLLISFIVLADPEQAFSNPVYDFNSGCQHAYAEIISLRIKSGQLLLDAEKKKNPENLIPYFLENYIDFFTLFFNEDPAEYRLRKDNLEKRLQLMSQGPSNSPFYYFTRSVLHFQWAAIKIKFHNNWDAAWEFRRSCLDTKRNQELFPDFSPSAMIGAAMEVAAGTIPDGYKWLSSILGIKGNIRTGMNQLDRFLVGSESWTLLFHDEAVFYDLYLKFYIENKKDEVFGFIRQHKEDTKRNQLFAMLAVNLARANQQSALAQSILLQRDRSDEFLDTPAWDFNLGVVRLNHLEPDAGMYLERYLKRFKGKLYLKDVLLKLSWFCYLNGDLKKAAQYKTMVLGRGSLETDADRQAMKTARSDHWPDKLLLKARLLDDGGYFAEAFELLKGKQSSDFKTEEDRLEFSYRLARLYDGMEEYPEAIAAYLTTLKTGARREEYYAARSALQIGLIYEKKGDKARASDYFRKVLDMKDHEYKNALDQRAKAGLERCGTD